MEKGYSAPQLCYLKLQTEVVWAFTTGYWLLLLLMPLAGVYSNCICIYAT
jgi:hypothetical protein